METFPSSQGKEEPVIVGLGLSCLTVGLGTLLWGGDGFRGRTSRRKLTSLFSGQSVAPRTSELGWVCPGPLCEHLKEAGEGTLSLQRKLSSWKKDKPGQWKQISRSPRGCDTGQESRVKGTFSNERQNILGKAWS